MSLEEFMQLPYKKRLAIENRRQVKAEKGKWVKYTEQIPVKVLAYYAGWLMVKRSDFNHGTPWAVHFKDITLTPNP